MDILYRRAFEIARIFHEQGKFAAVEQIYRRLLRLSPSDALALHNLSVAVFQQGRSYDAIQILKQAIALNSIVPEFFATMAEFLDDPAHREYLRSPFLGPFNGQTMRQSIFTQIVNRVQPSTVFETGTFRGTTTEFIAGVTSAHIFTCELEVNAFRFAERRFRDVPNITTVNLDSRSFLRTYVPCYHRPDGTSLFYLDAHWDDDLPLLEELMIVLETAPRSVVMIDDFEVNDDPGYGFDSYGPDRELTLGYLQPLERYAPHYFFPGPSAQESGVKRGCVVLTTDTALAEMLGTIYLLRPAAAPPKSARR